PVGDVLAQQILAGDAEVDTALADLARYFGGRQERDLDVVAPLDAGAVFPVVAGQADGQSGPGQRLQRLILEAAFRGEGEGDGHGRAPVAARAPSTMLRMVPLPRFAGEEPAARPVSTWILPRSRGRGTTPRF